MASQPPPKKDFNRNTRTYEERNSSAAARSDISAAKLDAGQGGSMGAAAAANRAKPKLPQRADFPDEASWKKAWDKARAARDSSPESIGQKQALKSLK